MDWKKFAPAAVLVSGLLVGGCEITDDDATTGAGGNPAAGTESAGTAATSAQSALSSVTIGLDGLSASSSAKTFKETRAVDLTRSVAAFQNTVQKARSGISPLVDIPLVCTGGGSASAHIDPLTLGFVVVYDGCVMTDGSVTTTMDLTITATPPLVALVTCGFNSYTFSMDGSVATVGSGVDEQVVFSNYRMDLAFSVFDAGCVPTEFSGELSGGVNFVDNEDPTESFSMNVDSLMVTKTAVTGGDAFEIDGTVTIVDSACFSGSLLFDTTTPLFFPDGEAVCPVSGEIDITGAVTGTVTYTAGGGIDIDEGSDGSVDQSFDDCEDAEACV